MRQQVTIERFTTLQQNAQQSARAVDDWRNTLNQRYQHHQYAPAVKRRRLEQLDRAASRHQDRLFAWLEMYSPRSWSAGVPCRWIVEQLTYADAMAAGALSTVPPPAFGYTDRDAARFAAPVGVSIKGDTYADLS